MDNTVLIVEDERPIVDILRFNLEREGYQVLEALDGELGLTMALEQDPDLILLDVMLPRMNGFDVCAALRAKGSLVPVVMLTAREEEDDKVFGLEAGADDYITKPFSMRELLARVKANIRRRSLDTAKSEPGQLFRVGDLTVDLKNKTVEKNGVQLDVRQKEFDLLACLLSDPGTVYSREELMSKVWNYTYCGEDTRTVDVTVRRLRETIEDDPGAPRYILTKRGMGYYAGT